MQTDSDYFDKWVRLIESGERSLYHAKNMLHETDPNGGPLAKKVHAVLPLVVEYFEEVRAEKKQPPK